MKEKILIVEDQFVEADYLRLILTKAGYQVSDLARSVEQALEIIDRERPDIVLVDIFLKGKLTGIDLAKKLQEENIAFVFLSANSNEEILTAAKATQPYGFLVKPFREKDLLVTLEIARFRHEHSMESKLKEEEVLKRKMTMLINDDIAWEQKLFSIAKTIQPYIPFDFLGAGLNRIGDISCNATSFHRISFDEYQTIGLKELSVMTRMTMEELTLLRMSSAVDSKSTIFNEQDFKNATKDPSLKKLLATSFNMQSHLSVPLQLSSGDVFNFCFYSRRPDAYLPDHLALVERLEDTWSKSIEAMLSNDTVERKVNNSKPVPTTANDITFSKFQNIVGKSHLMLTVLDQVGIVASSDTSVLILGESGTGKERIADSIHNLSTRKNNAFIKVNCAALPPTLIESELFGHEKGSFTGAFDKRIGKFEQADKGTIFLDEIGELPLEFQVKLLRVLQEKEIERIGSKSLTKVDVRIIAATNRNLEKEVAEGRFRLDLYYRLNVFPINLPSLAERKEDIPALAYHFVNYFNRKTGKKISTLSDRVLQKLMAYHWPGNIRELEHLIERNVLLAKTHVIDDVSLPSSQPKEFSNDSPGKTKTIQENERDYILAVLKQCNGRIWGAAGAAEVLNLPPSTLKSKMNKLGIKKEYMDS